MFISIKLNTRSVGHEYIMYIGNQLLKKYTIAVSGVIEFKEEERRNKCQLFYSNINNEEYLSVSN